MRYIVILLLLAGCATPGPVVPTAWVELDEAALQSTCRARQERVASPVRSPTFRNLSRTKPAETWSPVNGCFDLVNGVCVFYTRRSTKESLNDPRFQQTVGHEFTHCHKRFFHD